MPTAEAVNDSIGQVADSMARIDAAAATDAEFAAEERRLWQPTGELLEALVAASLEIGNAVKSGHNDHDRYDYGTLEDYLNAARLPLLKHGLLLVSRPVTKPTYETRATKGGAPWHVARVLVETRVIHAASRGWIAARVWGEGADRGDKALYKALTGGRKYSLAMVLGIYTTDEPEADSPQMGEPPRQRQQSSTPAPSEQSANWSTSNQEWLLDKASKLAMTEERSAAEAVTECVNYTLGKRAKGMTPEQFKAVAEAIVRRADQLRNSGQIAEEDGIAILQKLTNALAPTQTGAQMAADQAAAAPPPKPPEPQPAADTTPEQPTQEADPQ